MVPKRLRPAQGRDGVAEVRDGGGHGAAAVAGGVALNAALFDKQLLPGVGITAASYAAVVPELLTEAADAMDRALGGEA